MAGSRAPVGYWKARILGLTLDELAQLIRANADLEVTVLRDLTLEEFRTHPHRANDPAYRYVLNFNRQPLFGVAIGHHSPLGGYLPDEGLAFVLDVLEQYKPFLFPADRCSSSTKPRAVGGPIFPVTVATHWGYSRAAWSKRLHSRGRTLT
ncbi:MAG: hypothetical protein EA420_00510 [Candidatus Competibacteraceae bacterium]|nr:MAG: hypothetical protein EA420_00510 [Candidatus Competibacteraceae bacterium]